MIQLGLGSNFAAKVFDRIGRCFVKRQNLHRTFATQHLMDGFKNLSHAALPNPVDNDVRPERQLAASGTQLISLVGRDHFHLHQFRRNSFVADLVRMSQFALA